MRRRAWIGTHPLGVSEYTDRGNRRAGGSERAAAVQSEL